MRQTDRKGAIIGTVLAVMVLACVLLIIALVGTNNQTASASSNVIENGDFFYLNYGRIQAIEPEDDSYKVIVTYYDNGENVEENNRVKSVEVLWQAGTSKLFINQEEVSIFDNVLLWTYVLDVWAEDMDEIRKFDKSVVINSNAEDLLREGVAYYAIRTIENNNEVPSYYDTLVNGKYVFIGYNIVQGTQLQIENKHVVMPDEMFYNVVFCSTANTAYANPYNGQERTLNDIFDLAEVMILVATGGDYTRGYNEGIQYADGRVNTNSASYIAGYRAGEEGTYTFLGLMSAVVDAPVQAIAGIFNIEILGYNMLGFVTGLLTVGLIFFIVRKLGGGL